VEPPENKKKILQNDLSKIIAIIFLVMVVIGGIYFLSLNNMPLPDPLSHYRTFEFAHGGIRFSYPPNWITNANPQENDGLISFSTSQKKNTIFQEVPNFSVLHIKIPLSSSGVAEDYSPANELKKIVDLSVGTSVEPHFFYVDGQPAAWLDLPAPDKKSRALMIMGKKQDQIFFLFSCPISQCDQFQPLMENVIRSIHMLPIP
jgi:hypothetical protein